MIASRGSDRGPGNGAVVARVRREGLRVPELSMAAVDGGETEIGPQASGARNVDNNP
jgi:hypothetical protein